MKTIGIIGGTTWVSTMDYYRLLNKKVNKILGGYHSARVIIYSLEFDEVIRYNALESDDSLKKLILDAANKLAYAEADCLLLGANTMHLLADFIQERVNIPLIHIGEETAKAVNSKGLKKVGLLGTRITMEKEFYHQKLLKNGIEALIPDDTDREYLNYTIYNEFSKDVFTDEARQKYTAIIGRLKEEGAEGIILGCTEIPLLLDEKDFDIPLFNTTEIHAEAAVSFALDLGTGNQATDTGKC